MTGIKVSGIQIFRNLGIKELRNSCAMEYNWPIADNS